MNNDEIQAIEERITRMIGASQESDAAFALALCNFRRHALQDIRTLITEVRAAKAEIERLQWRRATEELPVSSNVHCEIIVAPRPKIGRVGIGFARYYAGENVWGGYYAGEGSPDLSMPVLWWREFVRPEEELA